MARGTAAERAGRLTSALTLVAARPVCVQALADSIRWADEYPRRPQLYGRLDEIEKAVQQIEARAQLLWHELTNPTIIGLLSDGDARKDAELTTAARFFLNIARRIPDFRSIATWAAEIPKRSPPTQGRGRLYPQDGTWPNEMQKCALIMAIAWQKACARWPGKDDPLAHQGCECLWKAAGGEAHGGIGAHTGTLTVWRNHIRAAKQYRAPHSAGALIERWLQEPDERHQRKKPSPGGLRLSYGNREGGDKNTV
jgi:hypothetical protein